MKQLIKAFFNCSYSFCCENLFSDKTGGCRVSVHRVIRPRIPTRHPFLTWAAKMHAMSEYGVVVITVDVKSTPIFASIWNGLFQDLIW